MSENSQELRQPDNSPDRSHLECIGSFTAYTQDGEAHTIEIWTHFTGVHDRDRARVEPGLLVLTTTEGHGIDRVNRGEYRLRGNPDVRLTTEDATAP